MREGGCKPNACRGTWGARLTRPPFGQAFADRLALKPYRGKPAVRNFRGGDGNVGIIRSPVRAIALPDYCDYGLDIGSRVDLVLWDARRTEEIVSALAPPCLVVKRGRLTVEHERSVQETWRSAG